MTKLIDKLRGKETEEETEMKEVLPPPENLKERLQRTIETAGRELQKLRETEIREVTEKQNKERMEKAKQEEINFENQTLEFVVPLVNRIKEEAGDLVNNPDFVLKLLVTCLAYELKHEKLIGTGYWDNRLFRFIRAYKRKGGNES